MSIIICWDPPRFLKRFFKKQVGQGTERDSLQKLRPVMLMSSAPYIKVVNTFLVDFFQSSETTVSFCSDDIKAGTVANPLLAALRGQDYERIKLRLRTISNLNPILNLETEEGLIHCVITGQDVKFRAVFAPKGKSILLEKLEMKPATA